MTPDMSRRKAVFLDRDGVIIVPEFRNGRSYAPRTLTNFRFYPDAESSVRRLVDAGYLVVVVTNQPDVGAGLIPLSTIQAMHERITHDLPVHGVKACLHTRADNCSCRKPKPGMIIEAARELGIDLERSFVVGDRDSDIEAGRAARCTTVFIDLNYVGEPRPREPDYTVSNLTEAVDCILKHSDG